MIMCIICQIDPHIICYIIVLSAAGTSSGSATVGEASACSAVPPPVVDLDSHCSAVPPPVGDLDSSCSDRQQAGTVLHASSHTSKRRRPVPNYRRMAEGNANDEFLQFN